MKRVWQLTLGKPILGMTSHAQTPSDINPLHYMPTTFSDEDIIYKYLEQNLFAVATASSSEDPMDVMVYLVNGVSGKIVYKVIERKVRLDLAFDMVLSESIFILVF